LQFPLIIKPIHEHGSIGISTDSVVYTFENLVRKVLELKELYKQPSLVEEYIDGREINAALLGNGKRAKVLPLSEILFTLPDNVPKIVSFDAKWVEGSQEYIHTTGSCPADLPAEVAEKIRKLAKKAYYIIGARDYCRVDFRVRDNIPYILEVNANPCINPDGAGFVRSANAAGLSYHEVIYEILQTSMRRSLVHSKEEAKA
jgi:D-alanine-D-alanine ligase